MPKEIKYYSELINSRIKSLDIEKFPANLYDPISYILDLGGKRLRPLIAMLSHSLFSEQPDTALDASVGVEVFHNFTLMHDDIMDKAPLRRGKQTIHKKWDPNIAILSGDVMLVKAYELLMQVQDYNLRKVLDAFNKCAKGVCEGQQIDMDFESKKEVDEKEYLEMIRLKTAVLLGFSMEVGAIIGGASDKQVEALKNIGENLGIGFQLKDDLLDVYGDREKVGKQVGGDIIANKKTFLWIEAWKNADNAMKEKLRSWASRESFNPHEKVEEVTAIFDALNIKKVSEDKMNSYFDKAMLILRDLDVPEDKKHALITFSEELIAREY